VWAPTSDEIDDGVRPVAPQVWEIDRWLVERVHRTTTYRTMRIIPHEENGEVVGVKVYGVRRASFLGHLGFMNGDMIVSVDDVPVGDPDAVLRAYSRLRANETVFVRIHRRGEDRVHVYRIAG
jgi:type II secretory pathway component PulC